jgi:hypothetical protein
MDEKELNKIFAEQGQLMMQLILRITALEQLLLQNNVITTDDLGKKTLEMATQMDKVWKEAIEKAKPEDENKT